jgi:hypothetical protein
VGLGGGRNFKLLSLSSFFGGRGGLREGDLGRKGGGGGLREERIKYDVTQRETRVNLLS